MLFICYSFTFFKKKSCQNLLAVRGLIMIIYIFISGYRHWLCSFFFVFSLHGAHFATHPYLTFRCFSSETLTDCTEIIKRGPCFTKFASCNMHHLQHEIISSPTNCFTNQNKHSTYVSDARAPQDSLFVSDNHLWDLTSPAFAISV